MNWLVSVLQKEARRRRFNLGDGVRFLTTPRRGKGNTVLMPDFRKGKVKDWNRETNRYLVDTGGDIAEEHEVHPRNMMADSFQSSPVPAPALAPEPLDVATQEGAML